MLPLANDRLNPLGTKRLRVLHGILSVARIYVADKFPRSQAPLWRGERYNNPKIRVGYLSGEFRHHVIFSL